MTSLPTKTVDKPRLLFRPDPVLGWSLSPGYRVRVGYRAGVVQTIDADGWRSVPRPATALGPRIAFYGCSFTYGTGLGDDETYTARLQAAFPETRVLNRGIGGQGTVQNYLQLRRDLAAGRVDAAVFALIADHRFRNVAHPSRMRQYLSEEWYRLGVEHVPVLSRDAAGDRRIHYVPIWQPAIEQGGFDAFLPDDWMLTEATIAVLSLIEEEARRADMPLRFVLLDARNPRFNAAIRKRFDRSLDISVPHDAKHTYLPRDHHPNARANALYAERLVPVVEALSEELRGGSSA